MTPDIRILMPGNVVTMVDKRLKVYWLAEI